MTIDEAVKVLGEIKRHEENGTILPEGSGKITIPILSLATQVLSRCNEEFMIDIIFNATGSLMSQDDRKYLSQAILTALTKEE